MLCSPTYKHTRFFSLFHGGVISYDNTIKENVLNVDAETLATNGAVSEETVREMSAGAKKLMETDYAISISGIMGPDGGE